MPKVIVEGDAIGSDLTEAIKKIVRDVLEEDDVLTTTQAEDGLIRDAVDEAINDRNLIDQDDLDNAVEDFITQDDVNDAVGEKLEMDLDDKIEEKVRDLLQNAEISI